MLHIINSFLNIKLELTYFVENTSAFNDNTNSFIFCVKLYFIPNI